MKRKKCSICGGKMAPSTYESAFKIGGFSVKVRGIPAAKCEECGETSIGLETMKSVDAAVAQTLAFHDVRSPQALKFMRKAMGIRAIELAELFGVTPKTVSRWETGESEIDPATLVTLQAMVHEFVDGTSATRDHLRLLRGGGPKLPKQVELSLAG